METCIWKAVAGFEGLYEVSDSGAVRSLDRVVYQENRGGVVCRRVYAGRMLRASRNGPYSFVGLWKDNKVVRRLVHVLVAQAFIGNCPNDMETRHLDGNGSNNAVANLRYGTAVENGQDRVRHGTSRPGSKSHLSKLNEHSVLAIRAAAITMDRKTLGAMFGVTGSNIGSILKRETWRHI
jgi:hypothetical protein